MTNTDICNMALSHIAKGRIVALDENTETARQCRIHYDHLRRMLLRDYTWGFAKRMIVLARLDINIPGWEHVYALPEMCLAARLIFNEAGASVREFEKEKYDSFLVKGNIQAIGCDIPEAYLEYTYDATDAELFPPDFVEALSRLLASALSMALTANAGLQQTQYQLYQVAIQKAMLATAQEREKMPEYPDSYIRARE